MKKLFVMAGLVTACMAVATTSAKAGLVYDYFGRASVTQRIPYANSYTLTCSGGGYCCSVYVDTGDIYISGWGWGVLNSPPPPPNDEDGQEVVFEEIKAVETE